jgi:hypothetical protein
MIVMRVLMLELAGRGHQVTEVTPFLESEVLPNYTQIQLKLDFAAATGGNGKRKLWEKRQLACGRIYFFF